MARILIIDDSRVIRDLLLDFLADAGHFADATEDALEGTRMAIEGTYDIIFCDLHIPKRNGFEIYRAVKAKRPDLRFIMTDSMPDHLAEQVAAAGAPYCLRKPFDLDQLRDVLAKVCATLKTV